MGDQLYAYRGKCSPPYRDNDKVCRTTIYDSDGRHRTVYGCSPGDKTSYVVETEVTERVRPITNYSRYGSPPPQKKAAPLGAGSAYGEKYRRPASPARYHDQSRRPPEVDDFLNGLQIEASRIPPVHSTGSTYGGGRYGVSGKSENSNYSKPQYQDYRKGNNYGGGYNSSDDDYDSERDDDGYHYKPKVTTMTTTRSEVISSPKSYGSRVGVWGSGSGSPTGHGVGKLSFPTNSIDEAIDYLKGTTRPYGSNVTSDHVSKPYECGTKYEVAPEPVKPYSAGYGSGYGSDGSKPYGPKYQQTPEALKPYNNGGYGGEAAKTDHVSKPYGTVKSDHVSRPYGTAVKHGGVAGATTTTSSSPVIDCYEAARKYNGKVIRS